MTGRPTLLTQEMVDKAQVYLDETKNMGVHALLPTVEGLALDLHISRETVYAWSKDGADKEEDNLYRMFSDIVTDLKAAQGEKLIQNSLVNRYNPTIAKLILSGKHGYIEKQQTENTGEQKLIIETRKHNAHKDD